RAGHWLHLQTGAARCLSSRQSGRTGHAGAGPGQAVLLHLAQTEIPDLGHARVSRAVPRVHRRGAAQRRDRAAQPVLTSLYERRQPSRMIAHTRPIMLKAMNWAALPMSLAFLDSGCKSREIRSMAASTA